VKTCSGKGVFKYETHLHTKEASACASGTGAEMARAYYEQGYSGIIVTDHFFNGNTAIAENLPWEKRVEQFCLGYENALNEGEKLGLHVYFGWEFAYLGTEFLTYGLDKTFLLANPDMLSWTIEEYFSQIHKHGGFISHAHPFREADYIREIRLFPDHVDAVEVFNAGNSNPVFNSRALDYAKKHRLLMTSGSDSHSPDKKFNGGMLFTHEIYSMQEFLQSMKDKNGNYRLLDCNDAQAALFLN